MGSIKVIFSLSFLLIQAWATAACPQTMAKPGRVAIVAAVSSGSAIAPRFKTKGVESLQVSPKDALPAGYQIVESDFVHLVPYSSSLRAMALELRFYGVAAVIAGSEMGVDLADALSEEMGLQTNGTRRTAARRNKFIMQETIKAHRSAKFPKGMDSIRQKLVKTIDDFRVWQKGENESQYPVVVKPYQSAGTDGLFICENEGQVKHAIESLIGKISFLGVKNDELLVQEYLNKGKQVDAAGNITTTPGDEYVVDTISLNGKRIVTDVWRYHKTLIQRPEGGLSNIYDYDELLDFNDPLVRQLIEYSEGVLDALEIDNGPSHMEIMITSRGPVLVEVGARLIGGGSHRGIEEGTGVSPIDILYEAYFDHEAFLKRHAMKEPLTRKKHVWMTQLISHQAGTITAINGLEEIKKFPSLKRLDLGVKVEGKLQKTIDLLTSPGQAMLAHESLKQIKSDHAKLRAKEKNLFQLAP